MRRGTPVQVPPVMAVKSGAMDDELLIEPVAPGFETPPMLTKTAPGAPIVSVPLLAPDAESEATNGAVMA